MSDALGKIKKEVGLRILESKAAEQEVGKKGC